MTKCFLFSKVHLILYSEAIPLFLLSVFSVSIFYFTELDLSKILSNGNLYFFSKMRYQFVQRSNICSFSLIASIFTSLFMKTQSCIQILEFRTRDLDLKFSLDELDNKFPIPYPFYFMM